MSCVVFTGGARSGKSSAASALAQAQAAHGARVAVVVFGRDDGDDAEFSARIARHRADRPEGFTTIEVAHSATWLDQVPDGALLMLDCLGTLLGRVMEESYSGTGASDLGKAPAEYLPAGFEETVTRRFDAIVSRLCTRGDDTIIVTNEVGDGVVPTFASARLFRDLLGSANRRLVARADAAYLCVAGRLIDLAACPTQASWPTD